MQTQTATTTTTTTAAPPHDVTPASITCAFGLLAGRPNIIFTKRTLAELMRWRDTWDRFGRLRADDGTDLEIWGARIVNGGQEFDLQAHDFGGARGLLIEPRATCRDFLDRLDF